MSEKTNPTRKEKVEAADLLKKAGEQVLFQVVTTVLKNGQVNVAGFPASVTDSLRLVGDINTAMMLHFVKQASEGNLDSRGVIVKNQNQNKILTPGGVPYQGIAKIQKPETDVAKKVNNK